MMNVSAQHEYKVTSIRDNLEMLDLFSQWDYKRKVISIEQALGKIESNMQIVTASSCEPQGLMERFHLRADSVEGVKVFSVLTRRPYEFIVNPAMKGHFELCSWFHGIAARSGMATNSECVSYIPVLLHNIASDQRSRGTDIYFGSCTPPDDHGFVSLGLGTAYDREILEDAKMVILEVSNKLPRILGDTIVHVDDVDFFVENDHEPPHIARKEPGEIDRMIGEHICELVADESTIQLGIGDIPNAVALSLAGKKDLGVHTEMLVDSMMDLYEMGVITNRKKSLMKGKTVCAFMFGSPELYEWADNNPSVMVLNGSWVNDPAVVRQNSKMVSINTCMMVDFAGQVLSEGIGVTHYSGTGGQLDTAMGAKEGLDGMGKSIIACRSTAKHGTASAIVPFAPQGTKVTLHGGMTDYVVTEYGTAWLRGKTIKERTKSLIGIAHPDFRDELTEQAKKMGYM